MKRIVSAAEYTVYIILFNIMIFIAGPINREVLIHDFSGGIPVIIIKVLSNLILFVITVFVIACFFKSQSPFTKYGDFFGVFFKKILPLCIAVRLAADMLEWAFKLLPGAFTEVLMLLTEAAALFWMFYFAKSFIIPQRKAAFKNRGVWLGCLALAAVIVWYTAYYLHGQAVKERFLLKYRNTFLFSYERSFGFELQLIGLLFGTVLWITLFISFGLFGYAISGQKSRKATVTVARALCLIIAVGLFVMVKTFYFPEGMLTSDSSSSITTSYIDEKTVACDYTKLEFYRTDLGKKKCVYEKISVNLKHFNNSILKFKSKHNTGIEDFCTDDFSDGIKYYRYGFEAVAYIRDSGECKAFLTERINGYSQKDDDLIAYAEYLIEQGYFEAFEYFYKYLLKYDKEFVAPYISGKRETADYFANNTVNGYLNKEYMKSFIEAL